ncbi:putative ATP-dependent helicase IRC20 [Madurella mycetomatis]|uniref:ATP-dependent helicase IRC20 n=1 Tax=Madurella mycetomatis TaxID=100816 RepID=A0A175VV87_9PEZI|nr:putative ATP-dependent helicase IRC20 [Madurella mycetomatis]
MPRRAKTTRRPQVQSRKGTEETPIPAVPEAENIAAFVERLRSIPSPGNDAAEPELSGRPAKRAKTAGSYDAICVAREHLTLATPKASKSQECAAVVRRDVGEVLALQLCGTNLNGPVQGKWQLHIFPRAKSRRAGFRVCFPLSEEDSSPELRAALKVAEVQGFDPRDEGCLWASVCVSVRQDDNLFHLDISIEIKWNERLTMWGSERAHSASQRTLRNEVFRTWYPGLHLPDATLSWSPQDFYEATCVPDKETMDPEVSSMHIPQLQAKLYPFQRRAVQWLLRREGVRWFQDSQANGGIQPYVPPASEKAPVFFTTVKDADGNMIYISPLLGVAARDTTLFRCLQEFRGGILAEEMGLGKTLEVIALMLLHRRPEFPLMVFDPFLGRELPATSATLIVAPSSLLDQWLSELNTHAPSLKVMYYPGIRKVAKLKDGAELSTENLAQQDVVITTYEVLRTEIWAASDEPGRSMRNEKQYERLKSPLVQLSWWRVCIDEAQMVENWTNNAAKLARWIPRVNAWGVTGTPVKDDIQKDLRGLLLFLRYEPCASDTKIWNLLTTVDKTSFRKLFNLLSMRHSKSLVRHEIAIPPQKRYVITMPFTAVEEQHYQSLFEELTASCGLGPRGNPLEADWDPEDPGVQSAMRIALDRLRQTVLHPEVGNRNRRALGQKTGPMRTVAEVLEAMLEQTDGAMRIDQRSLLAARLTRGQILACQKRVTDALSVWQEVLSKSTEMVSECRSQLDVEIQEARKGNASEAQSAPKDDQPEDREDAVPPRVGEARRRLRSALEIQHRAVFFCANAYFSIKSNEETTVPGSEEFQRLEKLEVEGYDHAKAIRKEILQESHGKAKKLMERLAKAAAQQSFAVVPEFKSIKQKGLESRKVSDALEQLGGALDDQANQLDDWREHVIQLLLQPLVDEENDETTGEEYEESTKLQDEILVYLQALRTALADRQAAITGQKNFLAEHETKAAIRMAMEGDGPFPERLLELMRVRDAIKPPFVEVDPLSSLRGLVSELRGLSVKLRHEAATGSSRAANELTVVSGLLKSTLSHQGEQAKAATAMEKEIERFMDTLNARIEFYRQLQEVSDMVGEYECSKEDAALEAALQAAQRQEESLQTKLATAESKHRYLLHLKEAESNSEEQRMCVICQSPFSIGVLTVCGHQFCKECITLWFRAHRNCPVCKRHLHQSNLHDITLKPQELKVHSELNAGNNDSPEQSHMTPTRKVSTIYTEFNTEKLAEIKNIDLDGPSFTTKVDTLTRHLLWLRESDPGAKSIVFSQYKEFLEVLALAFRRYRIGFTSFDKAHGITNFREDPGTEVFLLHARAHASGLNLVNASHVFLCEPLLNTALELQAIARVDRIGQQHETTVWLYIVDGTVEESIYDLSVQRRMEHMGRNLKGKSKESTPELLDANLEVANSLEMQQAHLSKLMGKNGISGEAVDKDDLWTCLFGHLGSKSGSEDRSPANPATRRFLAAEAAERRRVEG